MSIYHFEFKAHSLGKNPKLIPLRAYAYRVGAMAESPVTDPVSGKSYNYVYKREACWTETTAPKGAPDWMRDGSKLWSHVAAVERKNRKDAVMFYELEAALPIECDIDTWIRIVRAYVAQELTARDVVVTASIHNKRGNPHFHLMATTRKIDFEAGEFGPKNKALKQLKALHSYRAGLADHINLELSKLDLPLITHKSFASQAIDKEATQHVGVKMIDPHPDQKALQIGRERHNAGVKSRNAARLEARRTLARTALPAGACGAEWVRSLNRGPYVNAYVAELLQAKASADIPMPMSFDEQRAYNYMHRSLPQCSAIFEELGRVREALGRHWNWETFQVQYHRLSETQRAESSVMHALQVKELIWLVSRSPRLLDSYAKVMPGQSLVAVLQSALLWVKKNKATQLATLEMLLSQTQKEHAGIQAERISIQVEPAAQMLEPNSSSETYTPVLAPYAYLVFDMDLLVGQCQAVATASERTLSPGILAKRIERIRAGVDQPKSQDELRDALVEMEVVFVAKRRPHMLSAVLNAVPAESRAHFEAQVTELLGSSAAIDGGHKVAMRALSDHAQREVQAEFHLRQALSEFQLSDFEARRRALQTVGKQYGWQDFRRDIQGFVHADAGWQRAWWDEQLAVATGPKSADFRKTLPKWYSNNLLAQTYPLGAFATQQPGAANRDDLADVVPNIKVTYFSATGHSQPKVAANPWGESALLPTAAVAPMHPTSNL